MKPDPTDTSARPRDAGDLEAPTVVPPGAGTGRVEWRGLQLATADGVLAPWYSTEAMARTLENLSPPVRRGPVVVDVGCGTGGLGLLAALLFSAASAVLIDVDRAAARAAKASVRLNQQRLSAAGCRATVVCADGLTALAPAPHADLILCNLPFDSGPAPPAGEDKWDDLTTAFRDPGYRALAAVLTAAGPRLHRDGRIVLAASPTIGDPEQLSLVLAGTDLPVVQERTFTFRTPRRADPDAANTYCVSILRRPPAA